MLVTKGRSAQINNVKEGLIMVNTPIVKAKISSILLQEGDSFINPNGHDYFDLIIDNGYAYQKLAAWVKTTSGDIVIRTACIASRAELGRANISSSSNGSDGLFVINDDDFYTVSEYVQNPESIRTGSYAYSELNNVLLANSILESGMAGQKFRLTTGLPLKQFYKEDGAKNEKLIGKVKNSLIELAQPVNGPKLQVTDHNIKPEALSAFIDWFVSDTGEVLHEIHSGVMVIDIGGGTTDISNIAPNLSLNTNLSDTTRIGILDLFKSLRPLLSDAFNVDADSIRDDELDKVVRTGKVFIRGKYQDCEKQLQVAKSKLAKRLYNIINELKGGTIDKMIFVGGGAEALRNELIEIAKGSDNFEDVDIDNFILIPKNSQYTNVCGMLKQVTYIDD
ncbi:MAG: plasmid segregation protein ParM [Oleiphilaceae bacterium]|jgi:plasmid segregation protein ParM